MSNETTGPTGIVMMNLGGPRDLDEVNPFLQALFRDREIIQLPFHSLLGPFIANSRTKKVQQHYREIGGGSPLLHWTETQGRGMVERLDRLCPETAPHRFYVAFRYANPSSDAALKAMAADGVKRAVAFTQYPQYSIATTGSSMNELWRALDRTGLRDAFQWSVIDRWPVHDGFVESMTETVRRGLLKFEEADRDDVLLLFSAHSLPLSFINRGDPYPSEIGATVHEVMKRLGYRNQYMVSYQSEVGPVPWLGPLTEHTIKELGAKGIKKVLVVGVAFTSDHIETLHELDIEYAELAHQVGIREFHRAPAFNDMPEFQDALADIVATHLRSGEAASRQYRFRNIIGVNPHIHETLDPVASRLRQPVAPPAHGVGKREEARQEERPLAEVRTAAAD